MKKRMPKCFAIDRGGERVGAEVAGLDLRFWGGYIGFSHGKHSILLLVRAPWRVQRRDARSLYTG
jgi:hypothetical protein